jgi:CDP-diacylglycerol pyrophosphatase
MDLRALVVSAVFLVAMGVAGTTKSQNLLDIVSQCVAMKSDGKPTPGCPIVDADSKTGWVIVKDLRGSTQYLLVAADKDLIGIETAGLSQPVGAGLWSGAWEGRRLVKSCALARHETEPDDAMISLAVNSKHCRSVSRVHIHIDLVDKAVFDQLAAGATRVTSRTGHVFEAKVVDHLDNPFNWLARLVVSSDEKLKPMDRQTLVVVGRADGRFVILHDQTDDQCDAAPHTGDCACGEDLQVNHTQRSFHEPVVCP